MKIVRILFCVSTVLFFFLLGVSIADKEYLSKGVIGICILSEDQALAQQLWELVDSTSCADAAELCRQLEDSGFSVKLKQEKMYVYDEIAVMGSFPDAVYDTIIIDAQGKDQTIYLKQMEPVSYRFEKTQLPIIGCVQRYYIAFLSVLGRREKLTMDYLGGF